MSQIVKRSIAGFGVVLILVGPASGQGLEIRVGAGAAVPVWGAGERYFPGPAAAVFLDWRLSSAFSLRLDAEYNWMATRRGPYDMHTYGFAFNGVLRLPGSRLTPYVLAGLGAYHLQTIGGDPHPDITTALQGGAGVEATLWDRIKPFFEVRGTAHITPYAAGGLVGPTVFVPVLIGFRLEAPRCHVSR